MMRLYHAVLFPARIVVSLWAAWRIRRHPAEFVRWEERLGRRMPDAPTGGVWIHGASVGEARIASAVAHALRGDHPDVPLALSATTATGRAQLAAPPEVDTAFFMPFDFPGLPGRLFDRLRPRLLVLVETELWPNLLFEARGRGIPAVVINGRLSEHRMTSYRRLQGLYRPLLAGLSAVGAQSSADAERFARLGVPPERVRVTGNVKYDLTVDRADAAAVRAELGLAPGRPVFVAGSTAAGEDETVLDAFDRARRTLPELFLVLAPRHPHRADEVESSIRRRGLELRRTTERIAVGDADVLLVDEVGRLVRLYAIACLAFVGGSLVPRGGHNVLEPAAVGVPVAFGPHTESVEEPAGMLIGVGGAIRVGDAEDLARTVIGLARDPGRAERMTEAATDVLRANRGALERTIEMLDAFLPDAAGGRNS